MRKPRPSDRKSGGSWRRHIPAAIHPLESVAWDYKTLLGNGIPVYTDSKRCANTLAKLAAYGAFRSAL